ncbi:flagellar assembly protein FliH [Legionella antarctica]|uniref:Flagellar assembly protein FliH n=1 Tax=Legionella antarctica TaxID=2708020 RepID=A0A6F8T767_9GAMM|nr:flagellar assembly protein FliH [Legionella antarctica]BCA95806.1 flagellar assembly protein FliH [Legionella antarctica]
MSNEFEPYKNDGKNSEFSVWECRSAKGEELPTINPEEEFINECSRLRQEAMEKGYAEGIQQAQADIDALKTELVKWIELLQKPIQLMDDQLIQEVVQTMIWLSQHCIGIELSVNPEKLCDLFQEIKGELPSLRGNKLLAMHPLDVDWIKTEMDEKEIPGLHESLVADPSLSRGDFYLKGDHTELDGRIQTRFTTLFAKYIAKINPLAQPKSLD